MLSGFGLPLLLLPMVLGVAVALGWRRLLARDRRRWPLEVNALQLPGEPLRRRLVSADEAVSNRVVALMMLGPIATAAWLLIHAPSVDWSVVVWTGHDTVLLLAVLLIIAALVVSLTRLRLTSRRSHQVLAAELAVGQALTALIAEGYAVLHDVPADGFRIDHVVVGHSAVFAIESGACKPPAEHERESARLLFDGECLHFPDHPDSNVVAKARANALWLADYLASELGEPIKVVPVLAVPGWVVESTRAGNRSDVLVNDCKSPTFAAWTWFGAGLSESLRKRVVFGLGRRYGIQ